MLRSLLSNLCLLIIPVKYCYVDTFLLTTRFIYKKYIFSFAYLLDSTLLQLAIILILTSGTFGQYALAQNQGFPEVINLSNLDGSNGFRLNGERVGDFSGRSVNVAGDINADGITDLIIGAHRANPGGQAEVGKTYIVFGTSDGFPSIFNLSMINGSNGFKLNGEAGGDRSGESVDGIGDFNGDGIDDIIIGAADADPNGDRSGRIYIVFGSSNTFPESLQLADLDGTNGFILDGESELNETGLSVAGAGDVNGDGLSDIIIGAHRAQPDGKFWAGRTYVVFGSDNIYSSPLQLTELNGNNGYKIDGEGASDRSGWSVNSAGDINGDGFSDIIIGADGASNFSSRGRTYIIFGKSSGFAQTLSLASVSGSIGFKIEGESDGDKSGFSVASAGDFNGDGISDIIIGAPGASFNGSESGSSYIIFGKENGFTDILNLSNLSTTEGFRIDGESSFDSAGFAVNGADDINGDGFDDVIIGAPNADPVSDKTGRGYVVFGTSNNISSPLQLSSLDGTTGFKLNGESADDRTAASLASAGDINNDGLNDIIIGAMAVDANGNQDSGSTYVIYGQGIDDTLFQDGFESSLN